jgi:hypothetical protein
MAQTDVYEYIATKTINAGNVIAYQPGDPVPADNVKEQGYEIGVQVVLRKDYKPSSGHTVGTDALGVRGELPANLRGGPKPGDKTTDAADKAADKAKAASVK